MRDQEWNDLTTCFSGAAPAACDMEQKRNRGIHCRQFVSWLDMALVLHEGLASSDLYHVATAGGSQLLDRNGKTCEEIPDLHFIPVSLFLRGRLNQGVTMIRFTEYLLHVEGVPLFLPRGKCPRAKRQHYRARVTDLCAPGDP